MKKRVLAGVMISTVMTLALVGCGTKAEETVETTEAAAEAVEEQPEESPAPTVEEQDANVELPAYQYPGPEAFYSTVYAYVVDEFGQLYPEAEVIIPSVNIVAEDDSDKEDLKVYADFSIYTYNLEGDTLMTQAGGSHPGLMHLKFGEEGYEVTGFDAVGDGSDFDPTAKKIFGNHYDDFMKAYSDADAKGTIRAQIISNYVFANNLPITKYQDYGWDPVELPEQNIDSFYSQ